MFISAIILIICGLVVYYVYPFFRRREQLLKDYRTITPLPFSSIPFLGNLHLFDKRRHVFFQFLCQLSKQSQDQGSGLFCLWFGVAPRVFVCSGEGIKVRQSDQHHNQLTFSFI